jgi:uncharacterized protein YndB with AHSA1/START domain
MIEKIRQGDIPGVQLRCRRRFQAPAEQLWSWLTDRSKMGLWLTSEAPTEQSSEGVLILRLADAASGEIRERAETLEALENRRWVVAFHRLEAEWPVSTRLTFELTTQDQGCELSILQEGFAHLPLSECLTIWEFYRRRWQRALDRLEKALTVEHSE